MSSNTTVVVKDFDWNYDPHNEYYWVNCPILGECLIEKNDDDLWSLVINGSYIGLPAEEAEELQDYLWSMKRKIILNELRFI